MKENQTTVLNKRSIKFITISLYLFITACGGGGGGGGGSTSSTPAAPTYSYSTNDQLIAAGTFGATVHQDSAVGFYRQSSSDGNSKTGNYCQFFGELATDSSVVSGIVVTVTQAYMPQTIACGSETISVGDSMTFSIDFNRFYPDPNLPFYDFPGVWQGHLSYGVFQVGEKNVDTLSETAFHYLMWEEDPEEGNWPATQYVDIEIEARSYADSCEWAVYSGTLQTCKRIIKDTTFEEDIIAKAKGSTTFVGDMPSSGINSFQVKALMYGDIRYPSQATYDDNCSDEIAFSDSNYRYYQSSSGARFTWCSPQKMGVATGDQLLTVDFSNGTVNGQIELGYLLRQNSPESITYFPEHYDDVGSGDYSTAGTISVNATITGNSFSGTFTSGTGPYSSKWTLVNDQWVITSYTQYSPWSGTVSGHFFGPDGKEIGGVITMRGPLVNNALVASDTGWGVATFAGSMN